MTTPGIGAAQPLQPISPYSPLGKPAVGLESRENKDQTLPPIEQSSDTDKLRERLGQRIAAADGDHDADDQQAEQSPSDEPEPQMDAAATTIATIASSAALRPVVTVDANAAHAPIPVAKALCQFQQTLEPALPAGLVVDQTT